MLLEYLHENGQKRTILEWNGTKSKGMEWY